MSNYTPPPGLIDGAPVLPEAALQEVTQRLAADENAWFTRHLVQGLIDAGEPATAENLPDFAPRLSMRRYPSGVVVVALDSEPATDTRGVTLGRQLLGLGAPVVELNAGPLLITRPVLSGAQALAYELSLRKYPAEAFAFGLDSEPADLDTRLQQLYGRGGYALNLPPLVHV